MQHFQDIHDEKENEIILNGTTTEPLHIRQEVVTNTKEELKNRKAEGLDEVPNELIKYADTYLTYELITLFNKMLNRGNVHME